MFKDLNTSIQGEYLHLLGGLCWEKFDGAFDSLCQISFYIDVKTTFFNTNQRITFDLSLNFNHPVFIRLKVCQTIYAMT